MSHSQPASTKPRRCVTADEVLRAVIEVTGVPYADIAGSCKETNIVTARWLAVYFLRRLTRMSYPELSYEIGRTSHTTAFCAYRSILKEIERGTSRGIIAESLIEQIKLRLCRMVDDHEKVSRHDARRTDRVFVTSHTGNVVMHSSSIIETMTIHEADRLASALRVAASELAEKERG